jgi:predicted Zn-dependent peptidase
MPQESSRDDLSSLARLLRLVVRHSGEIEPDELKRQLREVPREEIERFALLLLELV